MQPDHNVVGWFEIPVMNMERAMKFYETVFDFKIERHRMGHLDMAWFPGLQGGMGSGGSLLQAPEYYTPANNGTLICFTAFSGDLNNELSRVEKGGGKVLQPKALITEEIGSLALLLDTEGNRIALHSRK